MQSRAGAATTHAWASSCSTSKRSVPSTKASAARPVTVCSSKSRASCARPCVPRTLSPMCTATASRSRSRACSSARTLNAHAKPYSAYSPSLSRSTTRKSNSRRASAAHCSPATARTPRRCCAQQSNNSRSDASASAPPRSRPDAPPHGRPDHEIIRVCHPTSPPRLMSVPLPDFSTGRVVVVGDVMLDRYWHGSTNRISPEAPVPIVRVEQDEFRAGGAGNVAINVASLGARADIVGLIGHDEAGMLLRHRLEDAGVACRLIEAPHHPTITKLRIISRHQQLIRLDFEESFAVLESAGIEAECEAALPGAGALVL